MNKACYKLVISVVALVSLTITTGEATAQSIFYSGDVNGDGKVTTADATIILRALKNPPEPSAQEKFLLPELCDVDGNLQCDQKDSDTIQKSLLVPPTDQIRNSRRVVCVEIDGEEGVQSNECVLAPVHVNEVQSDGSTQSFYCGDVNGDGKVTTTDASRIRRKMMKFPTLCDVNADGLCNQLDSDTILNSLLRPPLTHLTCRRGF